MPDTEESGAVPPFGTMRNLAGTAAANFRENWRNRPWLRRLGYLMFVMIVAFIIGWTILTRNLPNADLLLHYQPNLPSVVRDVNGEIVHRFERENRVELQYQDIPVQLINAFTSAEDETFWTHHGIDPTGFLHAVFDYVRKMGTGERAVGGSTITQQVAKNLLVGNAYSIDRKLREMILATRIERVMTKEQIITLYLNEIPLGRRSFGVQAAAQAYFNKDVGDLDLDQMAFLAILPKAPETYSRPKFAKEAIARRNFILDKMAKDGHITRAQAAAAKARPLGLVKEHVSRSADAGYFFEEVRRELIARYGETSADGPDSVYDGGLWIRTSLDTQLQNAARQALRAGLVRYHGNRGWSGPVATLDLSKGNLKRQLASSYISISYKNWRVAVVTAHDGDTATIGFANGDDGSISGAPHAIKVGDVVAVSPEKDAGTFKLEDVPRVSGGFLAEQVSSGRILAMQGGFDYRLSPFNRATQAERQPGSTIKPFVYATGLDEGMTPATMVPDTQYCYYQGAGLGEKCFRNFANEGGGADHPMRYGLEQSRNLMTVHIAMDAGMPNVIRNFVKMGIADKGQYQPYPAYALGAGDTTVERLVNAYAALANGGRINAPTVIDYVQDRNGKVIWRADNRPCNGCNMPEWNGKPMPRLGPRGRQVMDPRTAYQIVHMLTGVIKRGTGVRLRSLDFPLFGKTGTTSGPTNAWFIGGSPDMVAGTYVGFDHPRSLGGWIQGGNTAAPIIKQFIQDTRDRWNGREFVAPPGIQMVRIDRHTGQRVFDSWPTSNPLTPVIWEAFKPHMEPHRAQRQDQIDQMRQAIMAQLRLDEGQGGNQGNSQGNFAADQGGIY